MLLPVGCIVGSGGNSSTEETTAGAITAVPTVDINIGGDDFGRTIYCQTVDIVGRHLLSGCHNSYHLCVCMYMHSCGSMFMSPSRVCHVEFEIFPIQSAHINGKV